MIRHVFSFAGLMLLTGVTLLATPETSQAQGRGRWGGYSGRNGGGYNYAPYSGYRNFSSPYNGYGYNNFNGYGYNNFNGYRYPNNGYYNSGYYGTYPSYATGSYYGTTVPDYSLSTPATRDYRAFYPSADNSGQADNRAFVTVSVPVDAQVWIDDTPMESTGTMREFYTPPLDPGQYTYNVKARWTENGREVNQTRQVKVSPGQRSSVEFLASTSNSSQVR